ncbi:MAG: hypothetical protein JG765_1777 [Cereibacter sp.]|jgi:uncharacterized membrane protein|nr:hypothetical protein [Cereibacter sp.]
MTREHLRTFWESMRTSFWFVPSLMIGLAALLAWGARLVDRRVAEGGELPLVYRAAPDTARDLVATLLTSMMTMTSLIFSITMVVLSLASSQFGPRLIRIFMASKRTQFVLGCFVMTIVYCLLLSAMLGAATGNDARPLPSVTLAVALVALSVCLLGLFQHVLARSIMSETVVRRVGGELDALIRGFEPLLGPPDETPERLLPERFAEESFRFGPGKGGYIRAIAFGRLVEVAREADCLVGLDFRAGDFVVEDGKGIGLMPPHRSDRLCAEVRATIVIGAHRTPVQDVEFSIRHLVEVALRAMSPSLNDPYTAIAVIDQLSATLSLLLNRELPPGVFRDAEGVVRVICPRPTHASVIGAAFDQIRQNGAEKPVIVIHLLEAIERIAPHARLAAQLDRLGEQVELILGEAPRDRLQEADLGVILRRAEAARSALRDRRLALNNGPAPGGERT